MLKRMLQLDEAALLQVRRWHGRLPTLAMQTFTRLGDASSWCFLALVLLAAGGAMGLLGLRIAVAALLATLLTQPLKRLCRRRRPSVGIHGFTALAENPDAFSFPSGHTAAATAVALALAGHDMLGALFASLALCIAASRVYLGAHYPLDVFAGAALGAVAGPLARALVAGGWA